MIQSIPGGLNQAKPYALPLPPQSSPAPAGGTTSVVAASTSRDVNASLSITTKEGDTFSISASFDTTASYAAVRGHGENGRALTLSTSSQVSLQVTGNLNEQEMKDISRIVKTFLHDLRAMLRGRDVSIDNVVKGDPKTLQSVSATAETSTTVTAVAIQGQPGPGFTHGPRPQPETGEDSLWRHRGDLQGVPRVATLPLPAASPFTPATPAPVA